MGLILGIESSCDDAAVAVVADDGRVLAERCVSQAEGFAAWGGVVPEIAARGHVAAFPGLVDEVLREAAVAPTDLAGVAVAAWPGLIGSLIAGVTCAKALAARWRRPFLAVDHIAAHLAAVHLNAQSVTYPLLGLVASGGHSHYYLLRQPGAPELLGGTIDDAAGEAFDKAAAILGLPYPGGPAIDRLAADGDPRALPLPRSLLHEDSLRLSFSGLKTALLYQVRGPLGRDELHLDAQGLRDACASFQAAVVDCLVGKLERAARAQSVQAVAVGGGVACNCGLRTRLAERCAELGWRLHLPAPRHCADNAAMVAMLGAQRLAAAGDGDPLDLPPRPTGAAGPRAAAR
jgi:N6-L-threonylcarbamoyladenine synthase